MSPWTIGESPRTHVAMYHRSPRGHMLPWTIWESPWTHVAMDHRSPRGHMSPWTIGVPEDTCRHGPYIGVPVDTCRQVVSLSTPVDMKYCGWLRSTLSLREYSKFSAINFIEIIFILGFSVPSHLVFGILKFRYYICCLIQSFRYIPWYCKICCCRATGVGLLPETIVLPII